MNISNELKNLNLKAFQSTEKILSDYTPTNLLEILSSWINDNALVDLEGSFPFLNKCKSKELVQNRLILYLIRLALYNFCDTGTMKTIVVIKILTSHVKNIEDIGDYKEKLLSEI